MEKAINIDINKENTITWYSGQCECSKCGKVITFSALDSSDTIIWCDNCNKYIDISCEV